MSTNSTKMSKILSTMKKEYGVYTGVKNQPKDLKGKGKVYLPAVVDEELSPSLHEEMQEKVMEEMVEKQKEFEKRNFLMENIAAGKEVSFDLAVELAEDLEEEKKKSVEMGYLIKETNRKMMLLDLMEERENMLKNINMKLEWDDLKKKSRMLNDYLEMKKSMVMVEDFMGSMVREEIMNMRHKGTDTKMTSKNLEVMSEEFFQKNEKMEIMNSNPLNCRCKDCRLRFLMYNKSKEGHNLASMKTCLLSDTLKMEVSADDERFSVYASLRKDKNRHISLMEKKNNKTVLDIKLIEMEERLWEVNDYDFSIGIMVNLYNMGIEKNISVSYSSFMLVSWIRLMDLDLSKTIAVSEIDKDSSKEDQESNTPDGSCFMRMLGSFLGKILPNLKEAMFFYSMAEIPEWMEMKFLTVVEKHHVYVRYSSKEDLTNHISTRRFKGSIKIRAYLLSTPMFRNVKWFMEEDSPEFLTWKEKQKGQKRKTVMSMLKNLEMLKRKSNDQAIENTLWLICINFRNFDEMVEDLYRVEMKELDSFYETQMSRLELFKEQCKSRFNANLANNSFYPLAERTLTACMDIFQMAWNEKDKFKGIGFSTEMFKK